MRTWVLPMKHAVHLVLELELAVNPVSPVKIATLSVMC
jgi:hypothetical protein